MTSVDSSPPLRAVVQQPDGKLVAFGGGNGDLQIVRYLADGSPDPSFGASGIARAPVTGGYFLERALALQGDGKIVVAGDISVTWSDILVARFDAGGTLDTTFGGDGIVVTDLPNGSTASVAVQGDGKIVVGGTSGDYNATDFVVVRYESDGDLDPTFGAGGVASQDLGGRETVGAMVLAPDGRIVLAGEQGLFGESGLLLVGLDGGGALDPTFDTGSVTTPECVWIDGTDLVRQPDGKLVAAGVCNTDPAPSLALLARFDADGSLDGTFGGDGISVPAPIPGLKAIALDAAGRIVGLPDRSSSFDPDFTLARIDQGGAPDATFGGGGLVSRNHSDERESASDLLVQADGKIVLAGGVFHAELASPTEILLARFLADSPSCGTDADCAVCQSCQAGSCFMRPRTGCTPAAPGGAKIEVVWTYGSRSAAIFKWDWRGTSAPPASLFDPVTSDDVGGCIFHSGTAWRVLATVAPASSSCGSRPCWSTKTAGGWRFRGDRLGSFDGLRSMTLDAKRMKIDARGDTLAGSTHGVPWPGGSTFGVSPPGLLDQSFVVQLHAGNGPCVEATYSNPAREFVKQMPSRWQYRATSD